jgi:hypothetical protein
VIYFLYEKIHGHFHWVHEMMWSFEWVGELL